MQICSIHLTLLFARANAINCLASDSGTPSAMIATTRIVGCFKAAMDEAAALHIHQYITNYKVQLKKSCTPQHC